MNLIKITLVLICGCPLLISDACHVSGCRVNPELENVMLTPIRSSRFICGTQSHAQDNKFKEGLIYDVKGPVASVRLHTDAPGYFNNALFDTDGKTIGSVMKFDKNGYPIGWIIDKDNSTYEQEKTFGLFEVTYDDNYRIASLKMKCEIKGATFTLANGSVTENKYFHYRDNSDNTSEITEMKMIYTINGTAHDINFSYTNYVYDNHGNWISRNVVETIEPLNNSEKSETREYVETRTISYYN